MDVRMRRQVSGTPERILRALTEPTELERWCCEAAEVTAERYWLKGRSVPCGGIDAVIEAMGSAGFRLRWGASVITVSAADTWVTVEHTGIPVGALPGSHWETDTWECVWSLWLRLLKGWVECGDTVGGFDYLAPVATEGPLVRQLLMPAPAEGIWQAIVDPAQRERWLAVPLGEELSRSEGRRVTYRFAMPDSCEGETVTWDLEEREGGTLVTLTHEGLSMGYWEMSLGWHDFLVGLYQAVKR